MARSLIVAAMVAALALSVGACKKSEETAPEEKAPAAAAPAAPAAPAPAPDKPET